MSNIFKSNQLHNINIKEYIEKRLISYDDILYTYAVINKKCTDEILIISNLPDEVVSHYIENHYQRIDPVIFKALRRISPFLWDEHLMINSKWAVEKVFGKIKEINIVYGLSFVLHDPNDNLALLTLYTDNLSNHNINNNEIQGILISTHTMLLQFHWEESEKTKKSEVEFTPRENEILYWSSQGKTYHETAIILGIKSGTVKFHMSNIVKKLGVSNAKHAISLSATLNIISPPSEKQKNLSYSNH